jgi:hypothetical protein
MTELYLCPAIKGWMFPLESSMAHPRFLANSSEIDE